MPELVSIPVSFFEVAIDYVRPEFKLWIDRALIVQAIFDVFEPWNPGIDDTEVRTTGKPSEQGFAIKLPLKRVSFFFGPVSCKFTRDDVDWTSSEETLAILDAGLSALVRHGNVKLGAKRTAIALHIQPRTLPFVDLLKPLIPSQLAAIEAQPARTMATVLKWENRKVTIDGSAALANGVYLKLERDFDPDASYEEIARQLRRDEDEVFRILGVEEDRR